MDKLTTGDNNPSKNEAGETKATTAKSGTEEMIIAAPPTHIIDEGEAERMISRFTEAGNKYPVPKTILFDFINRVGKVSPNGRLIGVGARFGRDAIGNKLNIALEPIRYVRNSADNSIAKYKRLDNNEFFGRASVNITKDYRTADRADFDNAVKVLHSSKVEMAAIPWDILRDFAMSDNAVFTDVWFQLAINDNNKLTVIVSRRDGSGRKVPSTVNGVTGVYLDDHDLIPPPPYEESED